MNVSEWHNARQQEETNQLRAQGYLLLYVGGKGSKLASVLPSYCGPSQVWSLDREVNYGRVLHCDQPRTKLFDNGGAASNKGGRWWFVAKTLSEW